VSLVSARSPRLVAAIVVAALAHGCSAVTGDATGDDAILAFNLAPEADCSVDPTSDQLVPIGAFDIAEGADGACRHGYRANVLLPRTRSVPDQAVTVALQTLDRQTILFSQLDPPLPNPFTATAGIAATSAGDRGVVLSVELIPTAYAEQLEHFDGTQLFAEVHVAHVGQYVYPIEICDGCLTTCRSELTDETTEQLDEQCRDDAGADGRLCVDPDC